MELDTIYNMDCLDFWADIQGFEGQYKISKDDPLGEYFEGIM